MSTSLSNRHNRQSTHLKSATRAGGSSSSNSEGGLDEDTKLVYDIEVICELCAGQIPRLLTLLPAQAGRSLGMPPASSRSAATAGHAKAVSDKKAVHLNSKRKSIATDPALLQGSSDEDGEGPQDHEEQESSLQEEASRRTGSTSTSIKSAFIAHRSTAASTSAAANSSPRRSTRLSGEGLGSSTEACTSKDTRNGHSQSKESTALSSKLQSVVPNKRKAPSGNSVAKPAGNTHPTPPESDLDTASRMKASAVQKKSTRHSQSPTQKSKKLKSTSGEPAHPKPRVSNVPGQPTAVPKDRILL